MVPVRWPTVLAVGSAVLASATSLFAQPAYTVIANLGEIGGDAPLGGVIRGADGALYGTTSEGGTENCGLVYRIDGAGTLTRLHEFSRPEGCKPVGELALGPDGGLYGVASEGGISAGLSAGYGTIYKVDADGAFTVLHRFLPATPGDPEPWLVPSTPYAGLMLAPDGFFYGTTASSDIYRISPEGAFSLVRQFEPPGGEPDNLMAALVLGSDGWSTARRRGSICWCLGMAGRSSGSRRWRRRSVAPLLRVEHTRRHALQPGGRLPPRRTRRRTGRRILRGQQRTRAKHRRQGHDPATSARWRGGGSLRVLGGCQPGVRRRRQPAGAA